MGDKALTVMAQVLTAIIGVAIIATLVSNASQTGKIITAAGNAFKADLTAAENPGKGGL